MDYTLRKAIEKDIPQIVELSGLLADYYHNIDRYWKPGSDIKATSSEFIKNEIQNPNTSWLVVEIDEKIIGYFSAEIRPTNPVISVSEIGHISNGFLLEEYRGKGIAKATIQKFFEWFKEKGVKVAEVTVGSKNVEGVRAWKGLGFEEYIKKMKVDL